MSWKGRLGEEEGRVLQPLKPAGSCWRGWSSSVPGGWAGGVSAVVQNHRPGEQTPWLQGCLFTHAGVQSFFLQTLGSTEPKSVWLLHPRKVFPARSRFTPP